MSGWKEEDLASFWAHYNLAQEWVGIAKGARQTSFNDFEWKQAESDVYSMLNIVRPSGASGSSGTAALPAITNPPTTANASASNAPKTTMATKPAAVGTVLWGKGAAADDDDDVVVIEDDEGDVEMAAEEEQEEEELSEEYIAFLKTTQEHREQRDKQRQLEEAEKRKERQKAGGPSAAWLNDEEQDEYVLANEVGIHGVRRQTVHGPKDKKAEEAAYKAQMREKYGSAAEKLTAMELTMNFKFTQHHNKHSPSLWPNIPLRF